MQDKLKVSEKSCLHGNYEPWIVARKCLIKSITAFLAVKIFLCELNLCRIFVISSGKRNPDRI